MKTQRLVPVCLVAMLVLITLSMFGVSALSASQTLVKGDLDQNGRIDSRDTRALILHLLGADPLDALQMKLADVDDNGKVNTLDVREILEWIVNEETASAPTITTTTSTTPTTTTTKVSIDGDGYYDDVVKP